MTESRIITFSGPEIIEALTNYYNSKKGLNEEEKVEFIQSSLKLISAPGIFGQDRIEIEIDQS